MTKKNERRRMIGARRVVVVGCSTGQRGHTEQQDIGKAVNLICRSGKRYGG